MRLARSLRVLCAAAVIIGACGVDETLAPAPPAYEATYIESSTSPLPLTPLVQLVVPTADNSGEAVHPDVVRFPSPWHGWEYWMAFTPFPKGNEAFENPSIVVSHDGLRWQPPAGLTNPLAKTPSQKGYNSDPDLTYDVAGDRLILIYREVTPSKNLIWSLASTDGIHWTKPVLVFERPNHGIVSPSVTFTAAGTPALWYVDAGSKNCSERVTHIVMQTAPTSSALFPASPERGWSAKEALHKSV